DGERSAREKLNSRLESLGNSAVTAARNAAYNALYRNALYLSPIAEKACKTVTGAMHMAAVVRMMDRVNGTEWLKRRDEMNAALEKAKDVLRREVSRSAGEVEGATEIGR